jgi:5-methylcytosine-specific restriction protein A
MPYKPKRPCGYPGCSRLVTGSYCEEHQKLVTAQYNKYGRDDFTKNFYNTPEWRYARKQQLEQHPLCEECLKRGIHTKATMVDHIVPIKQGGDKYDPCNLQSLCWNCHSRKSVEEGSRFGKREHKY